MSDAGGFDYIPVKEFALLELIFLTLAHKVTTSLSLSLGSLSIGNTTASWAGIQRERELSNVAIDYALVIDVSASMSDRASRPAPAPTPQRYLNPTPSRSFTPQTTRTAAPPPTRSLATRTAAPAQTRPTETPDLSEVLARRLVLSALMASLPPAPQCFEGHSLNESFRLGGWSCDVCGKAGQTRVSFTLIIS